MAINKQDYVNELGQLMATETLMTNIINNINVNESNISTSNNKITALENRTSTLPTKGPLFFRNVVGGYANSYNNIINIGDSMFAGSQGTFFCTYSVHENSENGQTPVAGGMCIIATNFDDSNKKFTKVLEQNSNVDYSVNVSSSGKNLQFKNIASSYKVMNIMIMRCV